MAGDERKILMDLSEPDEVVREALGKLDGDLLLLGAGGKIGLSLALMAKRAFNQLGAPHRVIAVSRFSNTQLLKAFGADEIDTVIADLADPEALAQIPDADAVIFLAGTKFGTTEAPGHTWMLNTFMPGLVAKRWMQSRFVVFSSGNVYGLTPPTSGGPTEAAEPEPVGEYAHTVLGRERIFDHFSRAHGTKISTIRLNYANEPRSGPIVDLALKIRAGESIDLTMGYLNLIWQSDCNRVTFQCLGIAASPPRVINVAGPQVSVRQLAAKLGRRLGIEPRLTGQEADTALLNDGADCWQTFGPPKVNIDEMIERISSWLEAGGHTWHRPTHFEVRDGRY